MSEDVQAFRRELKENLVDWLQLMDKTADDVKDDEPLFREGLGLDSLDAVEIVILMQRKYGIPQSEVENRREIFATFASLPVVQVVGPGEFFNPAHTAETPLPARSTSAEPPSSSGSSATSCIPPAR